MTTFHSTRDGARLHLGKRPASPLAPDTASFAELRRPLAKAGLLPKPPVPWGHGGDFADGPPPGWGMRGNGPQDDHSIPQGWAAAGGCGDCFWAGEVHRLMESARNAGRPVPAVSARTTVEQYAEYSGYDPRTGARDEGSDPQTALRWIQARGLRDDAGGQHRIGQIVALSPGNLAELWEGAYLLEEVGIGIVVSEAQERQFNAGEPWDWVSGSPEIGGHWVIVTGRPDADSGALITWGRRVPFSSAFYTHQNDESYLVIDPERYNEVTGETAESYTDQDLEKFITLVAKAKSR
jgi:hypothetical protein